MFSTVRIITTDAFGEKWNATGFIFGYPVAEGKYIPFLVTNRHVIENQMSKELHFITEKDGKTDLKNTITLPVSSLESHWHFHPEKKVDVAIMPFGRIVEHVKEQDAIIFYRIVNGTFIPLEDDYEELDALEDILFIGYPEGLYDTYNNTPIIRKGTTATHPNLDYQGDSKYLIEASVFGGSSGSPVFIVDNNIHWGKIDRKPQDSRILFMGIVSNKITVKTEGELVTQESKTEKVPQINENFHLGIVYKPHTIMEAIESAAKEWDFKPVLEAMKKNEKTSD